MKNDLISIIIPIYNTPLNLLNKCLNSIYNQSYKNLEIVIVDDGSDEKYRSEYREKLINKDFNIKIIDKNNSGVSDSRNVGLKNSNGKYVMFIDSDDYISDNYVFDMYSAIKKYKVNVVVSGATIVNDNFEKIAEQLCKIKYNTKLKLGDYIETVINYPYFTCVKMLIAKDKIFNNFNLNIKYGEDLLFAFDLLNNNDIIYLNNCNYYYVQNEKSATHNFSFSSLCKYLDDNLNVFNYIESNYSSMKNIIEIRLFTKLDIALDRLIQNKSCSYKEFKDLYLKYINNYSCNSMSSSQIKFLSKYNQIKVMFLYKKYLHLYYTICKIKKIIK